MLDQNALENEFKEVWDWCDLSHLLKSLLTRKTINNQKNSHLFTTDESGGYECELWDWLAGRGQGVT